MNFVRTPLLQTIRDVRLRPIKDETGTIGFNVHIGGYFSIKRVTTTVPMNVWIAPDSVSESNATYISVLKHLDHL
jgi:sulfite reductase beta subunit-like hemoprotein